MKEQPWPQLYIRKSEISKMISSSQKNIAPLTPGRHDAVQLPFDVSSEGVMYIESRDPRVESGDYKSQW